jgi:hypothetical protein
MEEDFRLIFCDITLSYELKKVKFLWQTVEFPWSYSNKKNSKVALHPA